MNLPDDERNESFDPRKSISERNDFVVRFIRFLAMFALVVSTFVSGSTVSAAESGSSYNFGEANIYVNGQPFLTKVSKFTYNNTTYMSIYSAQLLINKLLGTTNVNGDIWRGDAWDITDTKVTPKILLFLLKYKARKLAVLPVRDLPDIMSAS